MLRPIAVCGATTVGLIVFLDRLVGILVSLISPSKCFLALANAAKSFSVPYPPKGEGERI